MSSSMREDRYSEYYLGLDIGTDSVGWCVTDTSYNVLKYKGKAMWGVRLFDPANTAAERRIFRTARRRLHRKQQRVKITQELLSEEIAKVDPLFYLRMQESFFVNEDKDERVRQLYTLFNDAEYTDREYHREFPTIYHLRKSLIEHKKKYDIRLYYLAIINFMKHRGHFLFNGDISEATSFSVVWNTLNEYLEEEYGYTLDSDNLPGVQQLLLNKKITRNDKKKQMWDLLQIKGDDKSKKEISAAICGASVSLDTIYGDPDLKNAEVTKISLADGINDASEEILRTTLGDRFALIERIKAIYDWSVLSGILMGTDSISAAQVSVYDKHKQDLKRLKKIVRKYIPEEYKEIFNSTDVRQNYPSYVGHAPSGKENVAEKRITEQRDFCDYIKGKLKDISTEDDALLNEVRSELEAYTFMPKQVSKSNSAIPYQVHLQELRKIVSNMGLDYPSLTVTDADGFSVCEKIIKLFSFRIPYYVGPLNTSNGENSWMVRKEKGQILPWNFEEKVDAERSAEKFIRRMTNKCTYLVGEDVLPKDSLLYSRFLVLNELNNLRVDGERIQTDLKQKIYDEVFKKRVIKGQITLEKLHKWLVKENEINENTVLSGVDLSFKSNLKAYHDFYSILGSRVNTDPDMIEGIINNIVIFGDDRRLLEKRIQVLYGDKLKQEEIRKICKLSYRDWGRLSRQFLNGIVDADRETGEEVTIIQTMWLHQENLMEVLSNKHDFAEAIKLYNSEIAGGNERITYQMVKDSYASPAVKRAIWQTLQIVKEIVHVTGHEPARLFVEVARDANTRKERTVSRKNQLLEAYRVIQDEERDWVEEINQTEERKFSSKKLFLYYTQMGKDMYSGEPIDLDQLFTNAYDIDHIYPQSKTKDDSILNNLVLVRAEENRDKGDNYPIPTKYRQPSLWNILKKKNLITEEKYRRLMRRDEFTVEELAGFISRQLVETRQSTKVVTEIIEEAFPSTTLVYSKANIVSDFRRDHGFVKCRSVNDYHHAKDAYLNIVVGNVYYTKFTNSPANYIASARRNGDKYSLNQMFNYDVVRGETIAWEKGKEGTIATVARYMKKNNVLYTRLATEKHGGFYDQMPLRKNSGDLLPLKGQDSRFDITKYGGYNKPSINYYMLVESEGKKGLKKRTIEGVPVYLSHMGKDSLIEYCENSLGLLHPMILVPEIKINSLLKLDGYPMHISGKSGKRIAMKNAVQLCVSADDEYIIHKIEKVCDKLSNDKKYVIDELHDEINSDSLNHIYRVLLHKFSKGNIFGHRPAAQYETMEDGKQLFYGLSLSERCLVICEILHLFQCRFLSADLKKIGGVGQAGVFMVNNEVTKYQTAKMINQSITGLFESTVDLLKV